MGQGRQDFRSAKTARGRRYPSVFIGRNFVLHDGFVHYIVKCFQKSGRNASIQSRRALFFTKPADHIIRGILEAKPLIKGPPHIRSVQLDLSASPVPGLLYCQRQQFCGNSLVAVGGICIHISDISRFAVW